MEKVKLFAVVSIFSLMMGGCIDKDYNPYYGCHEPIYISYEKLRSDYPKVLAPKEITEAAKIYVYGDILLVNELNKGIHVIDNRVKETPIRKSFIEIPGNIDLAVKEGYLYVDSFTDLVVLDIRDINAITKVHRKEKVFPYNPYQTLTPSEQNLYRCNYDETRGVIVGYK